MLDYGVLVVEEVLESPWERLCLDTEQGIER